MQEADLLLALLLSHPDRWMPVELIVECVWPDAEKQPDDATKIVTIIIMHLRRRGIIVENRRQFGYRIPREARGQEAIRLAA